MTVRDEFVGAGRLAPAYAAVDWAATSLGDPEGWSPSLRAMTELALNTEFAVTLLWGPDFTMIYNEAYVPIIGDKHPAALGAPAREVFPEIWDEIGPMMQGVRDGDGPVWMPDIRLLMNRHGFPEECFFNFCYSPVGLHDGVIEGVVDIVAETTAQTIAQRRLELLTRLGRHLTADLDRPQDVVDVALSVLRPDAYDLRAVDIRLPGSGHEHDTRLPAIPAGALLGTGMHTEGTDDGDVVYLRLGTGTDELEQAVLVVLLSDNLAFDGDYRSFLRLIADSVAQALGRIAVRQAEQRTHAVERGLSEALQRSLLTAPLEPDHLHVAVRYQPAVDQARIGGDWYDSFLLPDGALTVAVGDVQGHDVAAAAAMAQVRSLLRGLTFTFDLAPAAGLTSLDRAMQGLAPGVHATAVVARVEQTDSDAARGLRTLRWSNAGHLPPLLVSPTGEVTSLEADPELMLGVAPGAPRTDHTVVLEPSSSVVFFTDGLIERRDEDLSDSLAAIAARLTGTQQLSADELCDHLLAHFGPTAEDDIALLVVHAYDETGRRPPEAGPLVVRPEPVT